jgi:cell division protein FtsW
MTSQAVASTQQNKPFPLFNPTRPTERRMLLWVSLIFAVGVYLLINAKLPYEKYNLITNASIILASFWILHIYLVAAKEKGDELFLPLVALLITFGWLEIFRISPELEQNLAEKQMFWIIIGEICFVLWLRFVRDFRGLEDYKYLFLAAAIIMQVAVALFGTEVNGAKLWFRIGGFSIQPIEIIKIFLTIFLVSFLKQNREILEQPLGTKNFALIRYYVLLFFLWGIAESTLIIQKDLGMSLLLFGVFMGLFYIATHKWFLTGIGFGLFAGGGYLLYHIFSHVKQRIDIWWNPWADPQGSGFQIVQSLYSLANGGITGTGFGAGNPQFIPEIHTDFIFVALSEELGLIGALLIMATFLTLIQRMFRTAIHSTNDFSIFLAFGLAVMFATQVFIIVGGAVKFIPLTGITLPFVSYGGSSLVSNFILLGLFMQISGRIRTEWEQGGGAVNE